MAAMHRAAMVGPVSVHWAQYHPIGVVTDVKLTEKRRRSKLAFSARPTGEKPDPRTQRPRVHVELRGPVVCAAEGPILYRAVYVTDAFATLRQRWDSGEDAGSRLQSWAPRRRLGAHQIQPR